MSLYCEKWSVEVYKRFAVNLFSFRVFPLFFKQLSQMNLGKEVQLSFASDTNCEKHTFIKRSQSYPEGQMTS